MLLDVGAGQPINAKDIARRSRMEAFTVSRGVKTLLAHGLVRSTIDPDDPRATLLHVTERGQLLYERLSEQVAARSRALESALTAQERKQFVALLDKLERRALEILADAAIKRRDAGEELSAEDKEILRWRRAEQG